MAKVIWLRGPTGKGELGLKGALLDFLEHLPPKPEPACFAVLCFTTKDQKNGVQFSEERERRVSSWTPAGTQHRRSHP